MAEIEIFLQSKPNFATTIATEYPSALFYRKVKINKYFVESRRFIQGEKRRNITISFFANGQKRKGVVNTIWDHRGQVYFDIIDLGEPSEVESHYYVFDLSNLQNSGEKIIRAEDLDCPMVCLRVEDILYLCYPVDSFIVTDEF
jgi:hypothetical protein